MSKSRDSEKSRHFLDIWKTSRRHGRHHTYEYSAKNVPVAKEFYVRQSLHYFVYNIKTGFIY